MTSNQFVSNDLFKFGPFRLDLRARLLLKDGEALPLAPKSFDVLAYLVRNAGRAVSREELLASVWPDVVVSDGSLSQSVFVVRRALGESEESQRLLATVPRFGYRFSEDVEAVLRDGAPEESSAPTPAEAPAGEEAVRRRVRRLAAAAALLAALAVVLAFILRRPRSSSPPAEPRGALLSVRREVPVPPDAVSILGRVGDTIVLGAPSAVYLLPADGASPATRVPLAAGEVVANRLADGELLVAGGRTLAARHPVTQKTRAIGALPPDLPMPGDGCFHVSPGGGHAAIRLVGRIEVLSLGSGIRRAFRIPAPESANEALAISDRFLAYGAGGGEALRVYHLGTGEKVFEAPLEETRLAALALDDASERVAAAGAFDTVRVFGLDGGRPERYPGRGWTRGLAWVSDVPTLVSSGRLGLVAFRPGLGVVESHDGVAGAGLVSTGPDGVLVLAPDRQRLVQLDYAGFPPLASVALSPAPLWALEHDAAGRTLFVGGRDGRLWSVDVKTLARRAESVHTDGIPSLLREGDLLASSSDDKTVAVWKLPGPALVMRSRAHAFLVNDLRVAPAAPGGPRLVTASSDGTVKTWAWPGLEPFETVDLAVFAGGRVEGHALWTAPDASRILVGTWNHVLLDLTRRSGAWTGRRLPMASRAVYRLAELPGLSLVAGVGLTPHEVFLFDPASGGLRVLEDASLDTFWLVASREKNEVFVVGDGGVSRYAFERRPDGSLLVRLWSRRQSGLGLLTATLLPDGALWGGTGEGAVVNLNAALLDGPPLSERVVDFSQSTLKAY